MKKEWFVIQTLSGKEKKVQESINARVKASDMGDYIGTCYIPVEESSENKNGKRKKIKRNVFPGWVILEMALFDYEAGLDKETGKRIVYDKTWQFLRETPGLIMAQWLRRLPNPMTEAELAPLLGNSGSVRREDAPVPKIDFNVNDTVKINEGAFMGFLGTVTMIDPDRGKLKVEVKVFNRTVPVDVDYWQIEKPSQEELVAHSAS